MEKKYKFSLKELENQTEILLQKGITELCICDPAVADDKKCILKLLKKIAEIAPQVFVSVLVKVGAVDKEILNAACEVFCSFDIPFECSQKNGKLLFDKKIYASKSRLLNEFNVVFGFELFYACDYGDSLKLFLERLDFAVAQYPNHIDFPQTQKDLLQNSDSALGCKIEPKTTGFFSAKEIRFARDVAFACRTFYTCGRAVSWFLTVLKSLRIYASAFFSDFAEWQRCNNCDYKSGFEPENENHKSLEKMQLLFLEDKFEEKGCSDLFVAAKDFVCLNGAMSRLVAENQESIVETSYNPDDIFSPEAYDLKSFCENVCMENCKVRIFAAKNGPDYEILS